MNMNRRSFFRFFGRATGTAAAVVVGGAALLPKAKDADIQPDGWADGSKIHFYQASDDMYVLDAPHGVTLMLREGSDEWKVVDYGLLRRGL